jgi:hypothetical protein
MNILLLRCGEQNRHNRRLESKHTTGDKHETANPSDHIGSGLDYAFERRGSITQSFLMKALVGSSGTWAAERLSITMIPDTDHFTKMVWNFSVNSQNTFGQMTSVPVRNKKTDAYMDDVLKWARTRFPPKYRLIAP